MIGHDAAQLGVLGSELTEPLRCAHAHATKLGLPTVERRRADAHFSAHLGGGATAFLLLEDADDLLLRKSALSHLFAP